MHAAEIQQKSLHIRQQKAMKDAIIKFNTKPKLGVEYLRAHAGLPNDCGPREFATWIFEVSERPSCSDEATTKQNSSPPPRPRASLIMRLATPRSQQIEKLSKKKIGEFLGGNDEYNRKTLLSFLEFHDFTQLSVSDGLRQLLKTFRLPGEAQVIDRILESFADRFASCNPGIFKSNDCIYILAFSIIMLNTDLHSASIPQNKKVGESVLKSVLNVYQFNPPFSPPPPHTHTDENRRVRSKQPRH